MLAFCFVLSLIITVFPVNASADNEVYENAFNIQAALDYAKELAFPQYKDADGKEHYSQGYEPYDRDCTNFVSHCLVAAGLRQDSEWTSNWLYMGWHKKYAFINAKMLREYLNTKGYSVDSCYFGERRGSIYDTDLRPSAGDIVQVDWGNVEDFSKSDPHSVLCIGEDDNGILRFASHSAPHFGEVPFIYGRKDGDSDFNAVQQITVIYMTDTIGMEEVTSEFAGKSVIIKSNEVNQYVYADENGAFANRSNPVWYKVVRGKYGAVGFRAPNGKFLCTDLNAAGDSKYAPLAAKYQDREVQTWESFRIFRKGSDYYLQSQATGKWVQAVASGDANHTVKAAARAASSWERFSIASYPATEFVYPATNSVYPVIEGEFFIRSAVTGSASKMLDLYYGGDSTKYAKNIQIYGFNAGNNQKFYISHVGNGWHRIQSVQSGKSLDVEGGYSRPGANVIVWDSHNGDNQLWRFVPFHDDDGNGDGFRGFRIQSKLGYYLDVEGGFSNNETNVEIWKSNGKDNQLWNLYKTSDRLLYQINDWPLYTRLT